MLKAIPTVILLLLLYWYFRAMLFGPLEKVLKQREELTEGARKSAETSLAAAEQKSLEFEKKLNAARAEVYRDQEETRRKWLEDQTAQVEQARKASEQAVHQAKQQIEAEAAAARESLAATTATLADEIAATILGRKAGGRS
jgi:F-type H+-transporting ATPase subunit b